MPHQSPRFDILETPDVFFSGARRKGLWLPTPTSSQVSQAWQVHGFGLVVRSTATPAFNGRWTLRKHHTLMAILEGTVSCSINRNGVTYDAAPGDEIFIPAGRLHCLTVPLPCTYFLAYKMIEDDDEEAQSDMASTSFYANLRPSTLSPKSRSPRPPDVPLPPKPLVSKQMYITPSVPSTDTDVMGLLTDTGEGNRRLRKKRLHVTVVEGRDLPGDQESLYRVNLFYKDQVASTRTKLGHKTVSWEDSFIFDGSDKVLVVELQGIAKTSLNLNDFYDALFECKDSVTTWVLVPLTATAPFEESSRIKLELQAEFNPRRDSSADVKHTLSLKPLAKIMPDSPPVASVPESSSPVHTRSHRDLDGCAFTSPDHLRKEANALFLP